MAHDVKFVKKNLSILDIVNAFLLFHKNVANGLIYSPQFVLVGLSIFDLFETENIESVGCILKIMA